MKFTRMIASIVGAVALSLSSFSSVASGQCASDINGTASSTGRISRRCLRTGVRALAR